MGRPSCLIGNMDSTQFAGFASDYEDCKVLIVPPEDKNEESLHAVKVQLTKAVATANAAMKQVKQQHNAVELLKNAKKQLNESLGRVTDL